jgi:hypothetical protein
VNGHGILLSQDVEVQETGENPHDTKTEADQRSDAKEDQEWPSE